MRDVMSEVRRRAVRYLDGVNGRPVVPSSQAIARLKELDVPFPEESSAPLDVLRELDEIGSPATVATTGGRYFGFVTGGSLPAAVGASVLATAWDQNAVLGAQGWDVEAAGLFGAPPVSVIVGEAGNVNTGAFDPVGAIGGAAKARGAWVHVDGAFGLWAAAAPARRHLTADFEIADSWATDAHKWLNVPYDSGLVFVREAGHLRAAMSASAAYLLEGDRREPSHFVPEMSRRARGVEIWAALRSLGRAGLADLVERSCRHAGHFAEGLRTAGYQVLNQVDLNQVLVSFGDDDTTGRVIRRVQEDGTCWCGSTVWRGRAAMRISVSCWATAEEDVRRSLEAILRIAAAEGSR